MRQHRNRNTRQHEFVGEEGYMNSYVSAAITFVAAFVTTLTILLVHLHSMQASALSIPL